MNSQSEVAALHFIRIAGYANFAWLSFMLLSIKAGWHSLVLGSLPAAVSVLGALLYYTSWERIFRHTPQAEGRRFVRPYILGTAVLAGAVVVLLLLAMPGGAKA